MSQWITYVKKYAAANGISYKQALMEASDTYKKEMKKAGVNTKPKKQIQRKNSKYSSEEESNEESEEQYVEVKKYNKKYKPETDSEDLSYQEEETDTEDSEYSDSDNSDSDYDDEDHTYRC